VGLSSMFQLYMTDKDVWNYEYAKTSKIKIDISKNSITILPFFIKKTNT
jgi:hypothetical protein